MTSLESGSLLKLGDAPGALKMAFSSRSRVPSGEARPPVTEAQRARAGKAGRAAGPGWALGEKELREGQRNTSPRPHRNSFPLGPTREQVHHSLPRAPLCSRSRRNVLQTCAASRPAGGSTGHNASEREVCSWQEPISQMGEGKFFSPFSFPFSV